MAGGVSVGAVSFIPLFSFTVCVRRGVHGCSCKPQGCLLHPALQLHSVCE